MPGTPTTKYGIATLTGSDIVKNGPASINGSLTTIDSLLAPSDQGALSSRPVSTVGSPGKSGRTYWATDTKQLFRDSGTGWDEIARVQQQAWQTAALTGFLPGEVLSYYKDSLGVTHFKGNLHAVGGSTVAGSSTLAALPAGYRPGANIYMPIFRVDTVQITWAMLNTAGALICSPSGLAAGSMVSFGPAAFRAEN